MGETINEHLVEWRKQILRDSEQVRNLVGDKPVHTSSVVDALIKRGMTERDVQTAIWNLISEGEIDFDWNGQLHRVPEGQATDIFEPDAI